MIKNVNVDYTKAKETFIINPIDYYGTMNYGVGFQIKNQYPDVYRRCQEYCESHLIRKLPGKILLVPTDDGKVICNIFCQERCEYDYKTDLTALSRALNSLRKIIPYDEKVAMPSSYGWGSRSNWSGICSIVKDTFRKHTVMIYL